MDDARKFQAVELMMQFSERTGLTSSAAPRRYLWTDAFAVCNFLGLARATGDPRHIALALELVEQVHHELGRHRGDDGRQGWLSGLEGDVAEAHPTCGGLRIGKPLPERVATEVYSPELEWERDGQYFHYLTKWMVALDQVTRWTGQPKYNGWARELAHAAHQAFVSRGLLGDRRMVWKLSIDLSRALVPSMGHHDPLDGLVTCMQLEATAAALDGAMGPSLDDAIADFAEMLEPEALATTDPLGLGGLLVDAGRLAQLDARHELVGPLLAASVMGLREYLTEPDLWLPAQRRLAFRELGLAIGLASIARLESREPLEPSAQACLEALERQAPLRAEIETFWLQPQHRRSSSWLDHADINDVMLATSLVPDGFLALRSPERAVETPPLPPPHAAAGR